MEGYLCVCPIVPKAGTRKLDAMTKGLKDDATPASLGETKRKSTSLPNTALATNNLQVINAETA